MKHTDETRRKLSEMHRGSRNPFFGRKHTPEAKARMANWSRRFNLETRQYEINPRTVKDFTDCQAAYLAALIDGEGSISWRREHPAGTNSVWCAWQSLPEKEALPHTRQLC